MSASSFNPFEDKTLHYTIPHERPAAYQERAPFNDVIRHVDIVAGYQAPKRIEHFPRWFRTPLRIFAAGYVLSFGVSILYQTVQLIVEHIE